MDVYIARQPIFDRQRNCVAYELLYRNGKNNTFDEAMDGTEASKRLISDSLTSFGLKRLVSGKRAFVNFTEELLMSDFAFYFDPKDVVIEILETVVITNKIIERAKFLHSKGYTMALDDYIGGAEHNKILPHVQIVKVDLMGLTPEQKIYIAFNLKKFKVKMLAEKVETQEDFDFALKKNYSLFQGYFFAKPQLLEMKQNKVMFHSYMRALGELKSLEPDFDVVSTAIQTDVNLAYKLLKMINSAAYYRDSEVDSVKTAVTLLGIEEVRRWVTLIMVRDMNHEKPNEIVKTALVRGYFADSIGKTIHMNAKKDELFLLGMFSLIDVIMGCTMQEAIDDLPITSGVKDALLGKDNEYYRLLKFIQTYEQADWANVIAMVERDHPEITLEKIVQEYVYAVDYADNIFSEASEDEPA